MITLDDTSDTVTLPDDILWADEFTWAPVEQAVDRTLTGGLVVQVAERDGGRPITLQSGPNFAWITRADLDQLHTWANEPGQELTLNIRGAARTVIFRHHEGPAIEAEMVLYHSQPDTESPYTCTIRLMEV